jgi:hypothetical protein
VSIQFSKSSQDKILQKFCKNFVKFYKNFSKSLVKIARIKFYKNFTKIHPVTVEVFHANRKGGRTRGHDEANSHFSQTPRIDA